MLYCHAIMPRAGLGNRLFPWARCCIYAHKHNLQMLAPHWSQMKLGPLLRGEQDLRLYHNLFQNPKHYITGLRRAYLVRFSAKLPEPDTLDTVIEPKPCHELAVFREMAEYFKPLNSWRDLLTRELQQVVRPFWQQQAARYAGVPIALHVRRGDFAKPSSSAEVRTRGLVQVPLSWFIDCLQLVRRELGRPVKAAVASDGTDEELRELLQLENVERIATGSAIGDLLALSQAKMLLASGSSFSAWAAFLGQMPALTHPGQSLRWFGLQPPDSLYVDEFDPAQPDPKFPAALAAMNNLAF